MGSGDLPSPEEIIREAERRIAARGPLPAPADRRLPPQGGEGVRISPPRGETERGEPPSQASTTARALNRGVHRLARHWVALLNLVIALYLGGAIAAPVLMHLGRPWLAGVLYTFYDPFCHQYPHRSFFLFGEAAAYPLQAPLTALEMNAHSHDLGDAQLGYKMALCQRDIAIYGGMLLAGLVYGPLRKVVKLRPLPLWLYLTFGILPMALDGGVQWLSTAIWQLFPGILSTPFETIPLMRVLTGGLFGTGVIAVGYPLLAEYFDDVGEKAGRNVGSDG